MKCFLIHIEIDSFFYKNNKQKYCRETAIVACISISKSFITFYFPRCEKQTALLNSRKKFYLTTTFQPKSEQKNNKDLLAWTWKGTYKFLMQFGEQRIFQTYFRLFLQRIERIHVVLLTEVFQTQANRFLFSKL